MKKVGTATIADAPLRTHDSMATGWWPIDVQVSDLHDRINTTAAQNFENLANVFVRLLDGTREHHQKRLQRILPQRPQPGTAAGRKSATQEWRQNLAASEISSRQSVGFFDRSAAESTASARRGWNRNGSARRSATSGNRRLIATQSNRQSSVANFRLRENKGQTVIDETPFSRCSDPRPFKGRRLSSLRNRPRPPGLHRLHLRSEMKTFCSEPQRTLPWLRRTLRSRRRIIGGWWLWSAALWRRFCFVNFA